MSKFIYAVILLALISCKTEKSKKISNKDRIVNLNSIEAQSVFLNEVFSQDQKVRKDEKVAIQQYGHNSPQHQAAIQTLMQVDEKNLENIEKYLEKHGHPKRNEHGREAADTPWLVVHHANFGKGVRKKYFHTFYKAYKSGDIYGNALTMYLNRMYNFEFNSHIEWNRPYKEEEEIDTLIQMLGLKHLVKD